MKNLEDMTLEELKKEKSRLIKKYKMLLGTNYAMPRILEINRLILKLEREKNE